MLMMRTGGRRCALPVDAVEETMRPLPVEALPGLPPFVVGASLIRGRPTPIVDLSALLDGVRAPNPARLVSVRTSATRRVGLLVDEVLGLWKGDAIPSLALPPLLAADGDIVEHLAELDHELVTVLRAGVLVPEEAWAALKDLKT